MNLNQLKYFYEVCVCGSLSEASKYLYISQPSLSSSIKSLEKEFGVSLFNRRYKGMELTTEGKRLFEMCKDILSRTAQLENIMKDLGNERTKLRLGVPPMIGSIILPYIYRDFCQLHPDITLEIVEDGRSSLLDKLSENYLDMIFLLHNNSLDEEFASTKVARLEIACCASKDNVIAEHKSVTPHILKNTPLVLFENSFFQTEEIKKWFACEKITPNIILQTKQLSTMLTMISSNVAAGFTFRELTKTNDAFIAIPTQNPMYADASLVWKKDSYYFGCMEKFRKYVDDKNPFRIYQAGQFSYELICKKVRTI